MLLLTKQMAEWEGVTEQLKAQDQMRWVQRINNIRDRAMEIVNHNLIYAQGIGRWGEILAAHISLKHRNRLIALPD